MNSSNSKPSYLSILAASLLVISAVVWGLKSRSDAVWGELPELVQVDVTLPEEAPPTLEESRSNGLIAALDCHLHAARRGLEDRADEKDAMARDEFEERYLRLQQSEIANLLRAPQLASADRLVRNLELNPRDVPLPEDEIRLLHDVVEAHRLIIDSAIEARDLESHHRAMELASSGGVLPVADLRQRIPADVHEKIARAAAVQDPTKGDSYRRIVSIQEARYAQEALGADVVLVHGGSAYLAPKDSVLNGLRHYDQFVDDRAIGMVLDILTIFSRNGAILESEIENILAMLGRAEAGGTPSGV